MKKTKSERNGEDRHKAELGKMRAAVAESNVVLREISERLSLGIEADRLAMVLHYLPHDSPDRKAMLDKLTANGKKLTMADRERATDGPQAENTSPGNETTDRTDDITDSGRRVQSTSRELFGSDVED